MVGCCCKWESKSCHFVLGWIGVPTCILLVSGMELYTTFLSLYVGWEAACTIQISNGVVFALWVPYGTGNAISTLAKEVEQRQLTHLFSNLFVEFWFAYSISRYKVRPERHCLYGMLISLGSTLAQRLSGGLCLAKPSAVSIGNVEVSISSKGQGVWTLSNLTED